MTSKEFSLKIENIVKEKQISYMDAVLWYCKENGIDEGKISNLISKSLKEEPREYSSINWLFVKCFDFVSSTVIADRQAKHCE